MSEIEPGTRIGDFVVESRLGVGGMGSVYAAHHHESGAEVALKVMHPSAEHQEILRRRFLREAKATMALSHPNLIRIVSSFEHEGEPVIAMERLRGASLKDYLKGHGKLPFPEVAGIFVRIVSGVGSAHAIGLVHRDLKPDNVFLLEDAPHVKVLDFGIAKLRKGGVLDASGALTKTGVMIGTPYYMAPEQAYGEKSVDHRADIWSIGMMMHEVLTGTLMTRSSDLEEVFTRMLKMPFPLLHEVEPSVPEDVSRLVSRMLEREADGRPTDLREVLEVLASHAPRVSRSSFDKAAKPLEFDEPSGASGQVRRVSANPTTKSEPLKLAPAPMRSDSEAVRAGKQRDGEQHRTASGTVIVEHGEAPLPPKADAASSASEQRLTGTLLVTQSDKPASLVRDPPAESGSQRWLWLLAAAIVIVCVLLLLRLY